MYMDQNVKTRPDQGEKKKDLDTDAVCHRFCSTYTTNTLPAMLLKGPETSK